MSFQDEIESYRDPSVVAQEKEEKRKNSVLARITDSALDVGNQLLMAHEFSLRMQMRDRENDNLARKSTKADRAHDAMEKPVNQRNPDLVRKTEELKAKMSRNQPHPSEMEFE